MSVSMDDTKSIDADMTTGEWRAEVVRLLREIRAVELERNERDKTRPDLARMAVEAVRKFIGDYDARTKRLQPEK